MCREMCGVRVSYPVGVVGVGHNNVNLAVRVLAMMMAITQHHPCTTTPWVCAVNTGWPAAEDVLLHLAKAGAKEPT